LLALINQYFSQSYTVMYSSVISRTSEIAVALWDLRM